MSSHLLSSINQVIILKWHQAVFLRFHGDHHLVSYPEEREVPAAVNACNLQVPHHDLAVLVVLPESAILLLQVRQRAQLILRASAHCEKQGQRDDTC